MKKRNWLMTIAFAVLSLTIISTCVIGSTYAKFVSKVSGAGNAQAAGFSLTAGDTVAKDTNVLMAPSVTASYELTVNYFSQVNTKITDTSANGITTGTGIFDADNWAKLITFYNAHYNEIVVALGLGTVSSDGATIEDKTLTLKSGITGGKVDTALKVSDLVTVTVNDGDSLSAIKTALTTAGLTVNNVTKGGTDDDADDVIALTVNAMVKDAKAAIKVKLTVAATWTTLADNKGGDVFDTFIGNCNAAFKTGTTLTYGLSTIIDDTASDTTIAKVTAGTLSEVGISLGITAEQVIA